MSFSHLDPITINIVQIYHSNGFHNVESLLFFFCINSSFKQNTPTHSLIELKVYSYLEC